MARNVALFSRYCISWEERRSRISLCSLCGHVPSTERRWRAPVNQKAVILSEGQSSHLLTPSTVPGPSWGLLYKHTYLYLAFGHPCQNCEKLILTMVLAMDNGCGFLLYVYFLMGFWRKCCWTQRKGSFMVRLQVYYEILEDKLCFEKHCLNKLWKAGCWSGQAGVQAAVFWIWEHFILFKTHEAFWLIPHREASRYFTTLISFFWVKYSKFKNATAFSPLPIQ